MNSMRRVGLVVGLAALLGGVRMLHAGELNLRLCVAAASGDTAAVARALNAGADPNGTAGVLALWERVPPHPWQGWRCGTGLNMFSQCAPPLLLAVSSAEPECVRLLLARGARASGTDAATTLRRSCSLAERIRGPTPPAALRDALAELEAAGAE